MKFPDNSCYKNNGSICKSQWADALDQLLQKLITVHEHCKMPSMDQHKLLAGCLHGLDEGAKWQSVP